MSNEIYLRSRMTGQSAELGTKDAEINTLKVNFEAMARVKDDLVEVIKKLLPNHPLVNTEKRKQTYFQHREDVLHGR